ncbi:probable CoA ligase CCL6 [Nymphaea colorata]|nr:probable CoA ligase CCL6 [Nymphaea colorata]
MASYLLKVEEGRPAADGRPSVGPTYRNIYSKDGLLEPPEGVDCPWDYFSQSAKRSPENRMLGHRQILNGKAGAYAWRTYGEVYDQSIRLGSAIRRCNVGPGASCGIYGINCPEWIITMEACNSHGIYYVPLYDSLGANAIEFIINHAEVSIAFIQENKIQVILQCLPKCAAYLKTVVSFGKIQSEHKKEAEQVGVSCYSWEEFILLGNEEYDLPHKRKDDICTIMYTSGTTGDPKGVLLTNRAMLAEVHCMDTMLQKTDEGVQESDSYLSFLPLAHVFDQVFENYCISKGASIGFWQGDVRYLLNDCQELKPTLFCGVPRVFDRIYSGINEKVSSGGALKKALFDFAYNYKLNQLRMGLKQNQAAPLFDKLIFSKIKQVLGGQVRLILSGAAPLPAHVEEFLRVTTCSVLVQGYGLTESCAGCFSSLTNEFYMIGTIGVPMTAVEARLESVPDMGYDALSTKPAGEICLRGATLFSGYHKRKDLTEDVLIDGWLHTGDIGEWQPNGTMRIIDRKKNIFKLSQGEYISVENVENIYSGCPAISSIWVYGNSFESFLIAVAVPNKEVLEHWATTHGERLDYNFLCQNPKAKMYVLGELNNTGQANKLRGFELLKAVHLEPRPFDMERDLITPTFKLKRQQLLKYYKDIVDELYRNARESKA